MDVKFNQKAFVFSLLSFFLSILIFAFGAYYLFSGDYTKDLDFRETRIEVINNEVNYFKNVYVQNAFSFSMHNSLQYALENQTLMKRMNNNYTNMNKILGEMIINGSIDGIQYAEINKTSVNYLFYLYNVDFYKNYKGNITYKVNAINIYEESPFYLSIQVLGEYKITTIDNISSWQFNDTFKVKVPIYEFRDPEFSLNAGKNYSIRYVDLYGSNINWTLSSFNESLVNVYSSMYIEPYHKYTLGTSFLNRLLNNSNSSYKNVRGFYSFDYDAEKKGVYDTSGYNSLGKFYGNSRLILKFDGNNTLDISSYNNTGTIFGNVNCNSIGVYKEGCYFDGDNDYIQILDNNSLDFNNASFSIVAWVKFNKGSSILRENIIFKENSFILRKSASGDGGNIDFFIWDGVDYEPRLSSTNLTNISSNSWNLIIATYNGTEMKLYINGIFINSTLRGNYNTTSNSPIYIGKDTFGSNFMNGSIDEVAIYSTVLTNDEISDLYKERRVKEIDYKDSLYGKGIKFDGIDDYISITQTIFSTINSNFSIDIWFKPDASNLNSALFNIPRGGGGSNLIIVTINSSNKEINAQTYHGGASENTLISTNTNLLINSYNYLTITHDGTFKKLYLNGKLINSVNIGTPLGVSFDNLIIGADKDSSVDFNQYFTGLIDEVKIYGRTLSEEDIIQNYYNYASKAKGCCNYITLINPNLMNYNTSSYNKNISYNSKLFYDYYNKNIDYNLTLWNLSNISSMQTNKEYYNFMLDDCMIQAYNVFSFDYGAQNINNGLYNDSCYNYVKEGIY